MAEQGPGRGLAGHWKGWIVQFNPVQEMGVHQEDGQPDEVEKEPEIPARSPAPEQVERMLSTGAGGAPHSLGQKCGFLRQSGVFELKNDVDGAGGVPATARQILRKKTKNKWT